MTITVNLNPAEYAAPLSATFRQERVRGFQPPWYTVNVYGCGNCGRETRIRVNWRGPQPRGAFGCECGEIIAI